ncbi:FG-GAP repeat domain-containing protein [Streptomyces vilmorinianum]|uniref:FG-GAP repeat domain-containing protein n=1 Tax=Streptomyces vilmorinianum TaxID=3051092 RepID=UPI0010FB17DD|nr:VCBS repeat-containing protein [Streptomyces vilmorinianum]
MRRIVALGGTAALLVAGIVTGAAGPAVAADEFYGFTIEDQVLQPGEGWAELSPTSIDGTADGTLVYALSKAPLTDPAWTQAGLPGGMTLDVYDSCAPRAGVVGVYTCPVNENNPFPGINVEAAASAAHGTTLHYGVVYAPRGADLAQAVKQAQTVANVAEDGRHAARTVTVKSLEHVAQNTLALNTPALPAGGQVTQSVTVHAVDKGRLDVFFAPSEGQRYWEEGELQVDITGVTTDSGIATCDHSLDIEYGGVYCDVDPGEGGPADVTVSYTLKAGASAAAWKIDAQAVYEVYSFGTGNPEKSSTFSIQSSRPVPTHHAMLARDKNGLLQWHHGTGNAAAPFRDWVETVGGGWQIYNALAKLSPVTVQATGSGVVGRDGSGVLWYYRTTGEEYAPLAPRTKVGAGWGIYNSLTGVVDVTNDGKADLIARDTAGVLWLYKGTGSNTAPFAPRTRIGAGWQIYNQLTGTGDFTGDKKADLLARDTSGALWLYKGTGNAAAPFAARVKVGTGWGIYPLLTAPGDLTDDGRADLVARDGAGVFWLYKGTGNAAAPYSSRTKLGTGWGGVAGSTYNSLL